MEIAKKRLIIMFVIILIIISFIIGALSYINKKEEKQKENNQIENSVNIEEKEKISVEQFYNVTDLINNYQSVINRNNYELRDGTNYSAENSVKEGIYSLLSENYVKANKITIENIYDKIDKINEKTTFVSSKMKVKRGKNVDTYLVYGNSINDNYEKYEKKYYFVNLDKKNQSFSIEPIKEKYSDIEDIKFQEEILSIDKNRHNKLANRKYDNEEIAKRKFKDLKDMLLIRSEESYNLLNKEYRLKKFGNYEGFKSYVEANYEDIRNSTLEKYQFIEELNHYICIDKKGKYYIFYDKGDNLQEVLLDIYTIDLPEFTKKYNNVDDFKKVGYNIGKFFAAINDKDYKYAYEKLDENFRKNKIPEQKYLEETFKTYLFKDNKVTYENVEKKGNVYVYDIIISNNNAKQNDNKIIPMTVIMKLKDNYDFVMSFSFK